MNDRFPDGWLLWTGLGGLTGLFTWKEPRSGAFPRLVQTSVPFLYSFARRKRISEEIGNWEKRGVGISHSSWRPCTSAVCRPLW